MENYIVINGKKAELTRTQLKQLGIEVENKNPFERIDGKTYYVVAEDGSVPNFKEDGSSLDEKLYEVANYCTDEQLVRQRALHETLNRILWRFACENGELENEWDGENCHFEVFFDEDKQEFKARYRVVTHTFGPFFPTKETAEKAIGLIRQFMEDHPDFKW